MELHKVISSLIASNKAITQKKVTDGLFMNQSQLSKWLGSGFLLSDERQALVVRKVLDLLTEPGVADLKENQEDIATLETYLLGVELKSPKDIVPDQPIYPNYPTYVSRDAEKVFKQRTSQVPFQLTIVGGKKTGKSSFLLFVKKELESNLVMINCNDFDLADSSFEEWMAKTIMSQCPWVKNRLRSNDIFITWFERNVLTNLPETKTAVTLIIDQIEKLEPKVGAECFQLLRRMMNQRALSASFKALSFIVACDEAYSCHPDIDEYSSSYIRAAQMIDLNNFSDSAVDDLVKNFDISKNSEEIAFWLTEHFSGHPYLTYQATYQLASGVSQEECLNLSQEVLWEDIFNPMQGYWPKKLIDQIKRDFLAHDNNKTFISLTTLTPRDQDCLNQSGLFKTNDEYALCCISLWVQNTLIKYFKDKKNA